MKNRTQNILFLTILTICIVLPSSDVVHGKTSNNIRWQRLETKYTIIQYRSIEDLKKISKKINYSIGDLSPKHLSSNSDFDDLANYLKKKVDSLYERVQEVLDMHKKTKKVFIKIYPNKNQLHTAYRKIYKKSLRTYETSLQPRAWYIYEINAICINVNDLNEGMLAHEMAHSIIDHYLLIRPPKASAEILARYVDRHLYK